MKIAAGLFISAAICLPSLYIFTCLSGSQARLAEVCGLLAGLLLLMTILLIGFAPVVFIFSQSTESLAWMGFLHLLFWFVATLFGVRFMKNGFAHTNAKSHAGLKTHPRERLRGLRKNKHDGREADEQNRHQH